MRRRFKLLAAFIGVPVVLVAAAVVVLPKLIDSDRYKGEVVALVREHTGHDLRIAGNIRLRLFPILSLTVTDTRVANPPGFTAPELARLPWLKVDLEPLALLAGRVEPRAVAMTGLVLNLERDGHGRGNWEASRVVAQDDGAASGAPAGAALAALAVGSLHIRDAAIHWRGADDQQAFDVSAIELRTGALRGEEGIDDVRLRATFPETGSVVEVRGDVGLTEVGRVLVVPELTARFRAPAVAGMHVEGTLETDLTAKLVDRSLALNGMRIALQASGDEDRRLRVDIAGGLGFDLANGRLLESALSLEAPGYSQSGMGGDFVARGVISGDLLAGTYTFHGMEASGTVAGEALAGARVEFDLGGTLHADVKRRKLSAPALALTGSVDGGGLPFAFHGDLDVSGNAGTVSATNMDLDLGDWDIDGAMTLRTTASPAGVQGVMDLRVRDQPVAGSFAAVASAARPDAFDVRADVVAELDVEAGAFTLRGRNAVVLRANVQSLEDDGRWRIGNVELGARLTDASLPDGELIVTLAADMDVDMVGEAARTDNLRMTIDESRIVGAVEVRGFDTPAMRVDLQADAIDADRLRLPITAGTGNGTRAPTMNATLAAVRALDFAGEVRVKKLTLKGVVMENVRLTSGGGAGGG